MTDSDQPPLDDTPADDAPPVGAAPAAEPAAEPAAVPIPVPSPDVDPEPAPMPLPQPFGPPPGFEPSPDLDPDPDVDPDWDDVEAAAPPARQERTDRPPLEPGWAATRARIIAWATRLADQPLSTWLTLLVVVGCTVFVAITVQPKLVLRDTTPTGGDMGAHVWGPMYLLHHVLPHGRLFGWAPDWYAGFPAFRYYMVVPALSIIGLFVGVSTPLLIVTLPLCAAVAVSGFVVRRLFPARRLLLALGVVLALVVIPMPYGVAFKLVTVSGLVTLPAAAWAFGRLANLRAPIPAFFSLAAVVFIYNREPLVTYPNTHDIIGTGNIIGGNMASTMAGEYSFSIALSLTLLYFGVLARGLKTGRHRALAGGLLALVALCHLLPFFFALLASVIFLLARPSLGRGKWLFVVFAAAGLTAAFWMVPFYLGRTWTMDMGFEQLPPTGRTYMDYLWPRSLTWAFLLAFVGLVVGVAYRNRVALWAFGCMVATGVAFRFMPQIQLWNARILPFYFLSLLLLAAVGAGGVVHAVATLLSRRPGRPFEPVGWVSLVGATAAVWLLVGMPLHMVPGATYDAEGAHFLGLHVRDRNYVADWAKWNYRGYEGKPAYPEYRGIVATMDRLGQTLGCGRAMWEQENDVEAKYGTPMALMLLPFWTDSCIGSMEGLYFESSATTPYHFLNASQVSAKPSNPARDLPYGSFDMAAGVAHLRMLGVKYYLAVSPTAIAAADAEPGLSPLATSGPWHVYEVLDSTVVEGLDHLPVVWNVPDQYKSWIQPAAAWYMDPTRNVIPFAADGPKNWPRATVDRRIWDDSWLGVSGQVSQLRAGLTRNPLPEVDSPAITPAKVTNVRLGDDSVSFDVDQVGKPVLVKVSYYPNWKASGASGPYRVTPNLMVVVPTSKHVSLSYGHTSTDLGSWFLTLVGLALLVFLGRRPAVEVRWRWRARGAGAEPPETPEVGSPSHV